MRILAVSGSLRAKSSNTAVLNAAKALASEEVNIKLYSGLENLPHFNPDLDGDTLPNLVLSLRQQIAASDGILISSPEYAHGVPGSLKNALDWLVGSVEFPGKPVALINTNPRATIAQASLKEILHTMSAQIIEPASVTLNIAGRGLNAEGIVRDRELSTNIKQAIAIFARSIIPG